MHPCVIWALPRVGSTTLGAALGALNEPFRRGAYFADAAEIAATCASGRAIKHIYEECPDALNAALADSAGRHGYRHVHLVRCSEFARLVSRGIAAQQVAWLPETAAPRFDAVRAGRAKLLPLDIPELLRLHRLAAARWRALRGRLRACLTVRFEDVTAPSAERRRHALRRLMAFLDAPAAMLARLDKAMEAGGQDTPSIWNMLPNLGALRVAMLAGGAL